MTTLAGLSLILIAVIFCTWPGMTAPLFTDDIHQLERCSFYTTWIDIFKPDVFGFYRPVKNALFLFASPLQKNLPAWHWVGLIAYLAATVGIFRIAFICLASKRAAWFATCLWALSPSCASTAIWLSCANISIGLMFAACVFHFHEQWAARPSLKSLFACVFFFAMALQCYESMIAVPALLFIRDLQQRRLPLQRQTFIRYGVYSLVALIYLIVRFLLSAKNIGDHNYHPGFAPDTTALQLGLSAPWFLWRHFLMWIFPFGTIEILGSYAWLRSASAASLVSAAVFLAALLTLAALAWKKFPIIAYGLLFFVVASLPAGNFIPNFNGPINDAYVTIPSVGLALLCASACELLVLQFLKLRRQAESGGIAIMAVLCVFVIYRLPVCGAYYRYWAEVWNRPVELMFLTSETRPFQFQPKAYASLLLFSGGYIEQAEPIAKEVIQEAPWNATARLTLARIAEYHQDYPAAEEYYQFVLNTPHISLSLKKPAQFELARILANNPARREDAAQLLRELLKTRANSLHPQAIAILASIYKDQGNLAKARTTLERGLIEHPHEDVLKQAFQIINSPHPEEPSVH